VRSALKKRKKPSTKRWRVTK